MRHRQIPYVCCPNGGLIEDCFASAEANMPPPAAGAVLLRPHFLPIDPFQRRQMRGIQGHPNEVKLNGEMTGRGRGKIMVPRYADWQIGEYALGDFNLSG